MKDQEVREVSTPKKSGPDKREMGWVTQGKEFKKRKQTPGAGERIKRNRP